MDRLLYSGMPRALVSVKQSALEEAIVASVSVKVAFLNHRWNIFEEKKTSVFNSGNTFVFHHHS